MKMLAPALLVFMSALSAYPIHAGIRCQNDIISIGDTSFEVTAKVKICGEVLDKQIISKETIVQPNEEKANEKVKEEKVIELWHIRVNERGGMYCYPLTFEAGRLISIGDWKRCN